MDIEVFEQETKQACLGKGVRLRTWIENLNGEEFSGSDNNGLHPIFAREEAGLSNSHLDDGQYYAFAWAFSGEPKQKEEDSPEYYALGLKLREMTLAGEFD